MQTATSTENDNCPHRKRGASYKLGLIRELILRLDDAIEEVETVNHYSDMTPHKRVLPDGLKGVTESSISSAKRARDKLATALAEVEHSFAQ